jgi:photosystem II stability/assembly factor-like uncharacterized protein
MYRHIHPLFIICVTSIVFSSANSTILRSQNLANHTCTLQVISAVEGRFSDREVSTSSYEPNLDCYWLLSPINARQIRLSFVQFSTEANADFVTIYDGTDTTKPVLGRFSGQILPPMLTSSTGAVLVGFTTTGQTGDIGWTINYTSSAIPVMLQSTPTNLVFPTILFGQSTQAAITLRGRVVEGSILITAPRGLAVSRSPQGPFTDTLQIPNSANVIDSLPLTVQFQPGRSGAVRGDILVTNGSGSLIIPVSGTARPPVFWKPANGPFSAQVRSLTLDPANTLLAGTIGGVYRTTSAGEVWAPSDGSREDGLGATSTRLVQSLFSTLSSSFAGTSDGLFVTTNGGRTWQRLAAGLFTNVASITGKGDTLIVSADQRVWRSLTAGRMWQQVGMNAGGLGTGRVSVVLLDTPPPSRMPVSSNTPVGSSILYAGTQDIVTKRAHLYRSFDLGETWARDPNFNEVNADIRSIAVRDNTVFLATVGRGLYRSTESGQWERIERSTDGEPLRDSVFQLAATRNALFAATYDGVLRSTDNGLTWSRTVRGLVEQTVNALATSDVDVYAGTSAGVFRSVNNGENWTPVNTGFTGAVITAIKEVRGILLAGTFGSGMFRSNDEGVTWTLSNSGLGARNIFKLVGRGRDVYASSFDTYLPGNRIIPGIYRSPDNGITWTRVLEDSINTPNDRQAFFGLLSTPTAIYAGTGNGRVWISENGFTWRASQIPNVTAPISDIAQGLGQSVIAATLGAGVWRTDDAGRTWRRIMQGIDASTPVVYAVYNSNGTLFAGAWDGAYLSTSSALYRSTNNGATWVKLSFPARFAEKPTSMQAIDGTLYVATDGNGIWRTFDNGDTWEEVNEGIVGDKTQTEIYSIFSANGNDLYAGQRGGAVISTSLQLPFDAPRAFLEIPDNLTAKSGDTLEVPIFLRSLTGRVLPGTTVSGFLRFNASLLMPVDEVERQESSVVNGERVMLVRFALPSSGTDRPLATVRLRAMLGSSPATPVLLTNLQTIPAEAVVIARSTGVFSLAGLSQAGGTRLFRSERAPLIVRFGPNPTNDAASVSLKLTETGMTSLALMNVFGQVVKTIANGAFEAGEYEMGFSTSELAAGMYFLTLQTPTHRITQAFSVVR